MLSESKIKDAYEDVEISVTNIMSDPSQKFLNELRDSLNKFFNDSKCKGVIYTNNIDKLFFGIYTMPVIPADDVIKVITTDKRYRVKEYYVELDSKLFSFTVNLTKKEITALLIHDIGSMVNDSSPCEEVNKNIDQYLKDNHETLKLSDSIHYKEILSYGFRDAVRKSTTIFEKGSYDRENDTMADFITWTNYADCIQSGFNKIDKMWDNYNREVDNKFICLSWVMRIYKDVLGNRIRALKTLQRCQLLTASQIERKEMNNMARRLSRIDDDTLLESVDPLLESIRKSKYPVDTNVFDCLDISKNDLVGIVLKQENLDHNEPDAIPDLLHSINNNMMLMKDYAENHETDKDAFKQWDAMYQELAKRRKQITSKGYYVPQRKMINTYKAADMQ